MRGSHQRRRERFARKQAGEPEHAKAIGKVLEHLAAGGGGAQHAFPSSHQLAPTTLLFFEIFL
jgi:hypothetical protein